MLDIQYTKKGLEELNYVIVSGTPKKGTDPEIRGLFLGIKSVEQEEDNLPADLFLWIYNNDTIFILNLKHYIISSTEVCVHKLAKKSQTVNFKDSEHCSAIAKLHQIQGALAEQKRVRVDGLIEVSTYRHLPEYLAKMAWKPKKDEDSDKSAAKTTEDKTSTRSYGSKRSYGGVRSYNNKTNQWEGSYTAKVETSIFKRTSRYSAEEAITNMKTKIEKIRLGKYKPAKLKKIPADKIKKEEKKEDGEKTVGNVTEEEAQYGLYGYGC